MVNSMRSGDPQLCYYLGEELFDMKEFSSDEFPMDVMFNFIEGRKHENYFKIVKDDEKYDNIARKVDGRFFMLDSFSFVIISQS